MRFRWPARIACAVAAPLMIGGAVIAQTGVASAAQATHSKTLYVSPSAKSHGSDRSCGSAAFKTIKSAVAAARAGSTVVVCAGTYHEQVVLAKPVTLTGHRATIDESGVTPGLKVTLPGLGTQTIYAAVIVASSHVTFQGFTVRHAVGEGLLAAGLGHVLYGVSVRHNTVVHNDLGSIKLGSPYFECAAEGSVPGDCGEGVHFTGVAHSAIRDNYISQNSGGTLLSDDTGPTHHNVIEGNVVTRNELDCGITVPGHNPRALNSKGVPQPSVAGVYDNVIRHNVVTDNGLKGEGAGVLFANAGPGTASYNNRVEGNYIANNELPGVTMHAHTLKPRTFEDLNGNVIVSNAIGKNNIGGDPLDGPPGPSDKHTTGVLVFSGGTHVHVTIARNVVSDNAIGIWLSKPVTASGLRTNKFIHVTVPISAHH